MSLYFRDGVSIAEFMVEPRDKPLRGFAAGLNIAATDPRFDSLVTSISLPSTVRWSRRVIPAGFELAVVALSAAAASPVPVG